MEVTDSLYNIVASKIPARSMVGAPDSFFKCNTYFNILFRLS